MSTVYISSLESDFGKALAKEFEKNGFSVVTEPCGGLEYFIDVTECRLPEDDKAVGMGIDPEVLDRAYQENVVKPLQALEKAFHGMTGAKRICFLSSKDASTNWSEAIKGFGYSMSKGALHNILTITKNTWYPKGYTFRLFDPMTGSLCPEKAAAAAYRYFTNGRYLDDDDYDRDDEKNLIIRDALGREIPW
ncbi:MAG: hypothetical protein IJL78_01980 [Lachnospiraceae bacterium]|nr:hypothetical protein [Lachnospiraceae bacterium]